jgi:two-component system, OmpR family, heavy metal sensor histidine kinase CusS
VVVSFRTRLFVVASLIVATVLAAVMAVGWSRVLRVEIDRLDVRLCIEARRLAMQPFRDDELQALEADVALKLRLASTEHLMLRFDPTGDERAAPPIRWRGVPLVGDLLWTPSRAAGEGGQPQATLARPPPLDEPRRDNPQPERCSLASFTVAGTDWRAARFQAGLGTSVIATDLASVKSELQSAVQGALQIVVPMALVLTGLGAWLLSGLSLRPVNRLSDAMKGVTQRALDRRLPSHGEDREFQGLIADYNTMLARLEASFRQASRFSADAAHELKTPLTILQGRIEQAVSRPSNHAMQADLAEMLDEVGRLATITRKLLLLSQADAGKLALSLASVNLTDVLRELMTDAQMLVTDQTLSSTIGAGLMIRADSLLLRQLLNNLINNAVRYSLPGGRVEVRSRELPRGIETTFSNETRPIPVEERARFFERFFRGDPAHNGRIEGTGLGLSLSREIARAHGGDLTLATSALDQVTLRLWLPYS